MLIVESRCPEAKKGRGKRNAIYGWTLNRRYAELFILADLRFFGLVAFFFLSFIPVSWAQSDSAPVLNSSGTNSSPSAMVIEKLLKTFARNGSTQLFDGTFVYLYEDQIRATKVHRSINDKGFIVEEFIPQDDKQENSSRILNNQFCSLDNGWQYRFKAISSSFPFRVNNSYKELQKIYDFSILDSKTVAGNSAIGVDIHAKDPNRYSYQIWFEPETGTLLKYKLVNNEGKAIEQYLFTDINLGRKSDVQTLPRLLDKSTPCRQKFSGLSDAFQQFFAQDMIPKGYQPVSYREGQIKESERQARQFQLSDGLSSVSVFIEDRTQVNKKLDGVIKIGPMSVAGKTIGQHQVTVIGAIPVDSAVQFVNSIKP